MLELSQAKPFHSKVIEFLYVQHFTVVVLNTCTAERVATYVFQTSSFMA